MISEQLSRILGGKIVLITGAGGMLGSEICRQVSELVPARIVCLGRLAANLKAVRDELRLRARDVDVVTEVCDVLERSRLAAVFAAHCPNIVFHAAAKKELRDAEANPADAVMVNAQGTINVVELALESDSEMLLFTSSTKACQPASVMGATKRLGEMVVSLAASLSGRAYFSVRLSNILESSGGVHALFRRQIESGGPVTVTHPDAERIFVSAAETVHLLLEALTLCPKGSVLALAAGKKKQIAELAQNLIRSYGLQASKDINIEYTGLRRGERLVEEISIDGSEWLATAHDKILISGIDAEPVPSASFDNSMRKLILAANSGDAIVLLEQLQKIVPDYLPPDR
jgi:FlaA1/EpsC-like NDP-sugar epimerase|tara:strand:- start:434 stop:1468 length:1035 start_codon:yes stop_codon:yes gene_type:complete